MAATSSTVTYVTVSERTFFPGTVALVNSLRLTGNEGEVLVLDHGLLPRQRELLAREARIEPVPRVPHPALAKTSAVELGLRGTAVFVDSDALVCGSLDDVVARAREGSVCMFADHVSSRDTFHPEWAALFGLTAPLRRQTYCNAGLVVFSLERHPRLLERWHEAALAVHERPDWLLTLDQDALNAVLMSEFPEEILHVLPDAEGPLLEALRDVEVEDEGSYRATLAGTRTLLLHYVLAPKPWLASGWLRMQRDAYVQLLLRSLWWDDVPLRLEPDDVPRWLRPHASGRVERTLLYGLHGAAAGVARRTPTGVRRRLFEARDRLAA